MHGNVWIRKKNIDAWNRLKDKSSFVNTILEDYAATPMRRDSADLEHREAPYETTPYMYEGLDLRDFCYRPSNNVVYRMGEDENEPYETADATMIAKLKQLGRIWRG